VFYALPLADVSELLHEVWSCVHLTLALVPEHAMHAPAQGDDVRAMRADWEALLRGLLQRHIGQLGPHAASLLVRSRAPPHCRWHLAA
jgi:hypothetical protein